MVAMYQGAAIIHPEFIVHHLWKHHIVRFSDAFNHREPFWYYFIGIFLFMFPASYLIPSVTKFLTSRKPENRLLRTGEHGFLFLTAVWIICFFSISESKEPAHELLDKAATNNQSTSLQEISDSKCATAGSEAPGAVRMARRVVDSENRKFCLKAVG